MNAQNRVLKFRLWDGEKMITEANAFEGAGSGAMEYVISLCGNTSLFSVFGFETFKRVECQVMQWSGMQDKNNKDIYEGDIISLVNDVNETVFVVCKYGIARRQIFENTVDIPCFYFELPCGKKSFPIVENYAGKHDLELFEVVGNIYQNPELLKSK